MPVNLTFYKVSERRPLHGQQVLFVEEDHFNKTYDLRMGTVDYVWQEIDPVSGRPTGTTIWYDPAEPPPENCRRLIYFDDFETNPDMLWARCDDIEDQLFPPREGGA